MRENEKEFDFGPAGRPKYLRVKRAKGRFYYYFDTGRRCAEGKPVATALPCPGMAGFTTGLAKAQRERFKYETRIIPSLPRGQRPPDIFDPAVVESLRADGDDLYFVRCADAVKIGRAIDVWKRLANMQANNPTELNCICRLPGRGSEEPQWHAYFRDVWIRGEWFDWGPEIAAAIGLARKDEPWWSSAAQKEDS